MQILATLMFFLVLKETTAFVKFEKGKRVLHPSGRHLMHMHLESANLYGNATDLFYYYTNIYVGDYNNLSKQSLIINTSNNIT